MRDKSSAHVPLTVAYVLPIWLNTSSIRGDLESVKRLGPSTNKWAHGPDKTVRPLLPPASIQPLSIHGKPMAQINGYLPSSCRVHSNLLDSWRQPSEKKRENNEEEWDIHSRTRACQTFSYPVICHWSSNYLRRPAYSNILTYNTCLLPLNLWSNVLYRCTPIVFT